MSPRPPFASSGWPRVLWGGLFFAASLLVVFRAPTYHLWMLALVVTEWGHWLAPLALLALAPGWTLTRAGRAGGVLAMAAAVLLLTPVLRAERDFGRGGRLEAALDAAFGPGAPLSAPGAPARREALSLATLWLGLPRPQVRELSAVYARDCDGPLRLELYRPERAEGPLPVVLVVHGGSWRSGSRLDMPELSRYLAARGYAVASVDYGLAPAERFPGQIEDLREAAAFLRRRAARWGLDASRVALLGRSAGGQIVLAAAAARAIPGLKGVVDFYGPNDLRLAWAVPGSPWILDSRELLREYMGGPPAEFPKRYDEASPLLTAGPDFPPTLMIHGGRDELVWPVHEFRLSAKLKALGVPHDFVELPWATHGCDYAFSGPCGQVSTFAVERFLARTLAAPRGPGG